MAEIEIIKKTKYIYNDDRLESTNASQLIHFF